jgi:hypothetical protein
MTPQDVARWMLEEIRRDGILSQEVAAYAIAERFGEEFVYENENGNLAISVVVLGAFRGLSEATVVWSKQDRAWRVRGPYDEPGRQQSW